MAEQKKKSIKNTFKNIPTGARITMLIMVVFGIGSAAYVFTSFGSGNEGDKNAIGPVAQSNVQLGAKEARGFKVGDQKILDENSPLAQAEKEAKKLEIEKAKTESGGGYMAPFEISGSNGSSDNSDFIDRLLAEVDQKAEKQLDKERNSKPVPNGLDDVMNREEEANARDARIKRMEQDLANSKMARNQGGLYDENGNLIYNANGQKVVYQKRKVRAFESGASKTEESAAKELERSKVVYERAIGQTAELTGINIAKYNGGGGLSSPSSRSGDQTGNSPAGSQGYNPANDPSNEAFYAPYINQDRHIPKPDYEGLASTRTAVRSALGGVAGMEDSLPGFNQGGGAGSSEPYQFGGSDSFSGQPQESYEYGYSSNTRNVSYQDPEKPYKAIGDVCYGKLKMNVNSDAPTPVRVQFLDRRCGKLFNTVAVAAPARTGEYITLEFKGINVNGKTESINAIALDPESESALFQDSIDRHIFSRYISLAAAAALPGWADAVTGVDVEEDENGNERTRQAPVDALSDQLAVVAGSIGDALVPVLQSNFERPPTVQVYNNKDILIMFMGDFFIE